MLRAVLTTTPRPWLLVIALVVPAGSARAGIVALSTFDQNLDNWTSNTPSQVTWSSTGGNPGGFMLFQDASTTQTFVYAPTGSAFLGNLSSLNNIGVISYDDKIIEETEFESVSPYQIELSGPGGDAIWTGPTPLLSSDDTTGWVNVSAPLIEADWFVKSGSWDGLLSNVAQLSINIELVKGGTDPNGIDMEGIDNVELSTAPVPPSWILASTGSMTIIGYSWRRRRAVCAA
jgi:hypothetical protein